MKISSARWFFFSMILAVILLFSITLQAYRVELGAYDVELFGLSLCGLMMMRAQKC